MDERRQEQTRQQQAQCRGRIVSTLASRENGQSTPPTTSDETAMTVIVGMCQ